jgi:hypothetical protein
MESVKMPVSFAQDSDYSGLKRGLKTPQNFRFQLHSLKHLVTERLGERDADLVQSGNANTPPSWDAR